MEWYEKEIKIKGMFVSANDSMTVEPTTKMSLQKAVKKRKASATLRPIRVHGVSRTYETLGQQALICFLIALSVL